MGRSTTKTFEVIIIIALVFLFLFVMYKILVGVLP